MRQLQERCEFNNGIKTEWEPSTKKVDLGRNSQTAREVVRKLNREEKENGSSLRYRSVEVEDF